MSSRLPTTSFARPVDALNLIEAALKSNGLYGPKVERKNRCLRLNYERNFHLDIMPACRDTRRGSTCILVPDRRLQGWSPSNPKGFASWFDDNARRLVIREMFDKAEPMPRQESIGKKTPLKLGVVCCGGASEIFDIGSIRIWRQFRLCSRRWLPRHIEEISPLRDVHGRNSHQDFGNDDCRVPSYCCFQPD